MEDSNAERFGALGGVVFVVLDVAIAVLGGEPSATDAGRSEVAAYYADKGPAIEAGLWLFGLAAVAVVLLAASGFGVAAHLLATSVLGARTGTLSWWVVGVGIVSAVGFLGSAVLSAKGSSDVSSAIGFAGFALWCVWILDISSRMWTGPRPRSSALVS